VTMAEPGDEDVGSFMEAYKAQVAEWTGMFKDLSKSAQRHKTALPGALKIKKAEQDLLAIDTSGDHSQLLLSCQSVMRHVVLGVLDLTFAIEEELAQADFQDEEGFMLVTGVMDAQVHWAERLSALFRALDVQPAKQQVESADNLPPEIAAQIAMLAEAAKPQNEAPKAVKAEEEAWREGEGRLSLLLDSEVWEVICWRRGDLRHKWAYSAINGKTQEGSRGSVSEKLLQDCAEAHRSMLRAQGPVLADGEQPDDWKWSDSSEETSVLLRHGIYSSTHLLAMKQQAEVMFWLWKFHGGSMGAAERMQLEFTFIVEKVIQDRGWTAEWEKGRLAEMQEARKAEQSGCESEAADSSDTPSSTMEVLEQEFGSMDVQQEIDKLKKEDASRSGQ